MIRRTNKTQQTPAAAFATQRDRHERRKRQLEERKDLVKFIHFNVLMPCIDYAVVRGEKVLDARRKQQEFEKRLVPKHIFTATLIHRIGVAELLADALASFPIIARGVFADSRSQLLFEVTNARLLGPLGEPRRASIHSISANRKELRLYVLYTDGWMEAYDAALMRQLWGVQAIALKSNEQLPKHPVVEADEATGLIIVNTCSLDQHIRFYEPVAGRMAYRIEPRLALPPPPQALVTPPSTTRANPGEAKVSRYASKIQRMFRKHVARRDLAQADPSLPVSIDKKLIIRCVLYIRRLDVLVCTAAGTSIIFVFDPVSGALVLACEGHSGGTPVVRWEDRMRLLISGGGGAAGADEGMERGLSDSSVRVWDLEGELRRPLKAGERRITPRCKAARVLSGHARAVTDIAYLPRSALIVSASLDRTIRFWDPMAKPHALTIPDAPPHVRVWPGYYEQLKMEWTNSNQPFSECLKLQTAHVAHRLEAVACPLSGSDDPSAPIFEVLMASTRDPVTGGKKSAVCAWIVSRNEIKVEARRFDDSPPQQLLDDCEEFALRDWRKCLVLYSGVATRALQDAGELDLRREARRHLLDSLFRSAWLDRAGPHAPLRPDALARIFAVAQEESWGQKRAGEPRLTADEAYRLLVDHGRFQGRNMASPSAFCRFLHALLAAASRAAAAAAAAEVARIQQGVTPTGAPPKYKTSLIAATADAKGKTSLEAAVSSLGMELDLDRWSAVANAADPLLELRHALRSLRQHTALAAEAARLDRGARLLAGVGQMSLWGRTLAALRQQLGLIVSELQNRLHAITEANVRSFMAPARPGEAPTGPPPEVLRREMVTNFVYDKRRLLAPQRAEAGRVICEGVDEDTDELIAVTILPDPYLGAMQRDGRRRVFYIDFEMEAWRRLADDPRFLRVFGWRDERVDPRERWMAPTQTPVWQRLVISERLDGWPALRSLLGLHGYLGGEDLQGVLKFFAREAAHVLAALRRCRVAARNFAPGAFAVSPDGAHFKMTSLSEMGLLDDRGYIFAAADRDPAFLDPKNAYLPPEHFICRQGAQTVAYDAWCYGCMLFEMVFGRPPAPFGPALTQFNAAHGMPPPSPYHPEIHPAFSYDPFADLPRAALGTGARVGPSGEALLQPPEKPGARQTTRDMAPWLAVKLPERKTPSEWGTDEREKEARAPPGPAHYSVLDLIRSCLSVDPQRRPTPERILGCPYLRLEGPDALAARAAAARYTASLNPAQAALEVLGRVLDDLDAEAAASPDGRVNPDTFSRAVMAMGDLLTGEAPASPDGRGAGERERARVLRAVFEGRMLDRLVVTFLRQCGPRASAAPLSLLAGASRKRRPKAADPTLRAGGYPDPHDLVHPRPRRRVGRVPYATDEARRGWLPPEMDDAAAYMLDWLLSLYDDFCDQLREMSSACAPFVEPILHNLLRLYFGQEHLFESVAGDVAAGDPLAAHAPLLAPPAKQPAPVKPSLAFAAEPVDRWSVGLHHNVAPIVEELLAGGGGGGGAAYAAVRDFLRPAAGGGPSARVYVPTAPPGINVRVPRAGSFWREVCEAGESMARAFRFSQPRTRLSGLDHIRAVATVAGGSGPGGLPHPYGYDDDLEGKAEVLVALRAVERLAPLLDDPDAEVRAAVLRIFLEVAKRAEGAGARPGSAGARLAAALCTGPAVAAVVRRFRSSSEAPRAQRLALDVLATLARGDEPAVEALRSADAFAVLARSTAQGRVDGRWSASAAAAATRGKEGGDLATAVRAALQGMASAGSPACLDALERCGRLRPLLEAAGVDLGGARSLPDLAAALEAAAAAAARREQPARRAEALGRAAQLLARLEALVSRRAYVRAATGTDLSKDAHAAKAFSVAVALFEMCWAACGDGPNADPAAVAVTDGAVRLFGAALAGAFPALPHPLPAAYAPAPNVAAAPPPAPPVPSPSAPLAEAEPGLASLLVSSGALAAAARCLDDPFWEQGPEPPGQDRGIAPRPAAGAVTPSRALALANHPLVPARAAIQLLLLRCLVAGAGASRPAPAPSQPPAKSGPSATAAAAGQAIPAAELLTALAELEFGSRFAHHVHQQMELLRSLARVGGLEAHVPRYFPDEAAFRVQAAAALLSLPSEPPPPPPPPATRHPKGTLAAARADACAAGRRLQQQLLAAGFVDVILLDYRPDLTFVDVGHRLVPRSFIPYDRTFLVRGEATRLAGALAAARETAPDAYHALMVALRRHGVVQTELDLLREADRRPLQATAPAFLAALLPASHYDPGMHGLLLETGAGRDVERAHAAALEQRLRVAPQADPREDPVVAACEAFFAAVRVHERRTKRPSGLLSDGLRAGLGAAEDAGVPPVPGPAVTDPGEADGPAADGPRRTLYDAQFDRRPPAVRPPRKDPSPERRPDAAERWAESRFVIPHDDPLREQVERGQLRGLLRASATAGRAPPAGAGGRRADAETREVQAENRFRDPNQAPHYAGRFEPDPRAAHPRKSTPKRRYVVS